MQEYCDAASSAYLSGKVASLTDAVVEAVRGRGLNTSELRRVTEGTNRTTWVRGSATNRGLQFDPADPAVVVDRCGTPAPAGVAPEVPVAVVDPSDGVDQLLSGTSFQLRAPPGMTLFGLGEKAAAAQQEALGRSMGEALALMQQRECFLDVAVRQMHSGEVSLDAVAAAAEAYLAPRAAEELVKAAAQRMSVFGAIPREVLPKRFDIDPEHPLAKSACALGEALGCIGEARSRAAFAADLGGAVRRREVRDAR